MIRSTKFQAALGATLVVLSMLFAAGLAQATVPAGFGDETVFEGLSNPTMVRFAPDGRVFVAEKGGKILVFENLQDKTPEVFADLSKPVYDFEDHGLLGIALDPLFDLGHPYVYAIYSFNHKLADKETQEPLVSNPEGVTPAWTSAGPGFENDQCPDAEQSTQNNTEEEHGCEVSGLVVRMTAEEPNGEDHATPSAADPTQKVLLEGWCQQSTTHSIGTIGFGPEGNLFVSGGEGSMYSKADYGEFGNPCEDPYEAPHGVLQERRSSALGGSLRAQSVLRNHSLPNHSTLLSGTVLRVDPATGEGVEGNPFYSSTEKNAKRIIAFGFRQPWRFAFNPRTNRLFVDNVGDGTYEEMDRLKLDGAESYSDGEPAYNSGWPCYEGGPAGPFKNEHYAYASEEFRTLQYCIDMYEAEENGEPSTSAPFFSYEHSGPVDPDTSCDANPTLTDIGGISFYEGSNYPAAYKNALFFADPIRGCIYVMKAGPDGEPDPTTVSTFISGKASFSFPGVDMEQGPEGDIFYTEFDSGAGAGTVHRITHAPPTRSWEFDTPSHNFGAKAYGSGPTEPHEFTLTNTGETPLEAESAEIEWSSVAWPDDESPFQVTSSDCHNRVLEPAESCFVDVTFDPPHEGESGATLVVKSHGEVAPDASVTLSGEGTGPSIPVTPDHLAFGSVTVGTTSAPQTITLKDQSSNSYDIESISFVPGQGVSSGPFRIVGGTCQGTRLDPGATCTAEVVMAPTEVGTFHAEVEFSDAAPESPQKVGIEGTATPAPLVIDPLPNPGNGGTVITPPPTVKPPTTPVKHLCPKGKRKVVRKGRRICVKLHKRHKPAARSAKHVRRLTKH